MWLASMSIRNEKDRIMGAGSWSPAMVGLATRVLREQLEGVGDPSRERVFRMNITLCMHRAATDEEVAGLPDDFHSCEAIDIAGGPVAILSESVPGRESTKPCANPRQLVFDKTRPDLWFPEDCGLCAPCIARKAITSYHPSATTLAVAGLRR